MTIYELFYLLSLWGLWTAVGLLGFWYHEHRVRGGLLPGAMIVGTFVSMFLGPMTWIAGYVIYWNERKR